MAELNEKKERYSLVDALRGICVLGMVIYHTLFDIVMFTGDINDSPMLTALEFIRDFGAALFILISGFCFVSGKRKLKRFLLLSGFGIGITAVTYIVVSDCYVIFGILTFMAVSGAVMVPLERILKHIPAVLGLGISLSLFLVFFRVSYGYIGTYGTVICSMPHVLYKNYITAFFGFPFNGFVSGDYYGLFPWIFIYVAGYFLRKITDKNESITKVLKVRVPFFDVIGRKSLYIYLAHQPIVYSVVWLVCTLVGK